MTRLLKPTLGRLVAGLFVLLAGNCHAQAIDQPDGYGAHIPVKNDGSCGPQIVEYLEGRGMSWIVWVFDPQWSPR